MQLFLLYHRTVKLKNDLKSKGCARSTSVSCLLTLGVFCANWTFPPLCFFGWLNIAEVEGKSNNTLGVWSLFPDPSGTKLQQSDLRTETKWLLPSFHCCNPKCGGYFNVEAAHEKGLSLRDFF